MDLRSAAFAVPIMVLLLLLSGCTVNQTKLGLKTQADCDGAQPNGQYLRDVEKIPCYHQAAVSLAYLERNDEAVDLCGEIMSGIGVNHQSGGKTDDVYKKAETEVNLCYYDIAKVIARQDNQQGFALNVCSNIHQGNYQSTLVGAAATQKTCIDQVNSIAKIKPETYYSQPDNMCSVISILPVLLFAAFILRK